MLEIRSNKKKNIILIFIGVLILISFHPFGRQIVKWILPLGIGIMDLIGTGLTILFFVVLMYPRNKIKAKKNKSISYSENVKLDILSSLYELLKKDLQQKCSRHFLQVVEFGEKKEQLELVLSFMSYYCSTAIKLFTSKDDLLKHNIKTKEIENALTNIDDALDVINDCCDKFLIRLINHDLDDIETDITILGQINELRNLS